MHINVKYMPIQKIYLLYHCDYVNLPIYQCVLRKKIVGLEGSILTGIFVTPYVFCNLMYLAYFLYALHYPPYVLTILYTNTFSSYTSCSASHKDDVITSNW